MAIENKGSQPFEPYARLMNIIGDQLITDKKVAVIEVVKNSYDADAEKVQVRFFNIENYGKNYLTEKEQPYIEIEDDGEGMTLDLIKNVWLRPATPSKLDKKKKKLNKTNKGRIIQGEKGIGRFAIHKLGEKIEVYTKSLNHDEVKLEMDFTEFNPEKADLFKQPPDDYKLLNKVFNNWYVNKPPEIITKDKGTLIRIYNLREQWKENDFEELYKGIQRLIPPIDENAEKLGVNFRQDFNIELFKGGQVYSSEEVTTFKDVIERAQFTMIGKVSKEGILSMEYKATAPIRNLAREINLLSKEELSKSNYTSHAINKWFEKHKRNPACGAFSFTFYAFDLSKPDKTILTKDIEQFIKDNFVFVLRDGVRVYPYGEKGIDWLNLDKLRATFKAGQFISYNDLTGFVYISQSDNPLLRDSTNRQGIMNTDGALDDFTNLVTAVTEIFNTEIKIDKNKLELKRNESFKNSTNIVQNSFNSLRASLEKIDNKEVLEKANKFLDTIEKHNSIMKSRMETVEDLAGLGMAVEKASHDALTLLSKMRGNIKDFKVKAKNQDYKNAELISLLNELDESLNFVYDEMQVIQPLFKNQRKAIQDVSVHESIEKVVKYFRREIDGKIDIKIIKDQDILVKTNKGLVLQILINLLDNAIYWVNKNETKGKQITIQLKTKDNLLLISDNGPGIREDVVPLIFNEFFSLKSDGRGLGLYIVKEILLRINGEIFVIQAERDKTLSGANFAVKFNQEQ
ncbi:MAG: sensor histidine kinase [Flammeovirgaceae bacterium]